MTPVPNMDARLCHAVQCALNRAPDSLYDLKKIKILNDFAYDGDPYYQHTQASQEPEDFSAIGHMENLHTLLFGTPRSMSIPAVLVQDFSFLTRCKNLKKLDLRFTNFTDCALLLQLPALKQVQLPSRRQLTNLAALDQARSKGVQFAFSDTPPLPGYPPRKEPEGSDKAKAIVEEMKKRTAMDCYTLKLQPDVTPGLLDSKFGGFPYWNPALPYPVDGAGEKLVLLAQINFDQFHVDEPLPQGGLLQFFIAPDDTFGSDFDEPCQQTGFRVVYHERVDPSITEEQLKPLDIPTHEGLEYFPVFRQAAVTAEKTIGYIGADDNHFEALFAQVVKDLTGEDTGGQTTFRYLDEGDYSYLRDQLYSSGHRMLGYPFFTQYDPRPEDSSYDTLLFQIDSDRVGKKDYVLWGDCGVANFFINLEDLKKRDFSNVFYTWDCC